MAGKFTVTLSSIIQKLSLDIAFMPDNPDKVYISSKAINRPGIELTGFLEYFDNEKILVLGDTEHSFLSSFSSEGRYQTMDKIFSCKPPAVIITRNIETYKEIMLCARKYSVPILRSHNITSEFVAGLISYLTLELAPRITRPGVLLEVYGEGVLITGDSGIGKSETAIELIQRGHRLIADDAVEFRRINDKTLVGSSPENIRHFIELRGIGIINARRIFGMSAVKVTQDIDIVVNLELWDNSKAYDRTGIESEYVKILDVDVPVVTIPVKPGRNLAVIIEVAAMNNRQKKMGYHAGRELLANLGMDVSIDDDMLNEQITWHI